MRLTKPLTLLSALVITAPASAGVYKDAVNGLMQASYRHMAITFACRHATGASWYREAVVAAETTVRATGVPTDLAIATVARMTSRIEVATKTEPRENLVACFSGVASAKQEVRKWREEVLRSQH